MEGRIHLGNLDVDGNVIVKRVINKWDVRMRIGLIWLWIGTSDGFM
jgi:hypothetical protein